MSKTQKPKWFDSLNELAETTFDISFSDWQEAGYLTEKYRPYISLKDGKVVANASANLMNFFLNKKAWSAIQIGTVMTDEAFRNKGLAGKLIQEIILDWKDKVDFIYLFANDDSASFYPQFGFERVYEFAYSKPIDCVDAKHSLRKMDILNPDDLELLKAKYHEGNHYSAFRSFDNFELLMFYCNSFMSDCIYYIEEYDLVVILQKEETILRCFEILGRCTYSFSSVLEKIEEAFSSVDVLELGFTPLDSSGFNTTRIDEYDQLFILKGTSFTAHLVNHKNIFPLLSHA